MSIKAIRRQIANVILFVGLLIDVPDPAPPPAAPVLDPEQDFDRMWAAGIGVKW